MKASPFLFELIREQLTPYGLTLHQIEGMSVFPMYGVSGALLNAALLIIVSEHRSPRLALPIKFWSGPSPNMLAIKYAAEHFPELASEVRPDCSFPEPYTEEQLLEKAKAQRDERKK